MRQRNYTVHNKRQTTATAIELTTGDTTVTNANETKNTEYSKRTLT